MFLVDRPTQPPGTCIVNHSHEDAGGFIDLGDRALIDPRVYVSRQAVIDLGRAFGFPSPAEHYEQSQLIAELEKDLADANDELVQLRRDVEAAEWTLERKFQSKPQNKPGRKPKVTT